MPTVQYRAVREAGQEYSNYVEFYLQWPTPSSSCIRETLNPINPTQTEEPRWQFFWNFGDGTFAADTNDVVRHVYNDPGTFNVEVAMKPTYTDDHDPFGKAKMTAPLIIPSSPPAGTISHPDTTYHMIDSAAGNLQLVANWYASRPTGVLTFALSYRPSSNNTSDIQVGFAYPKNMFEVIEDASVWTPNTTAGEPLDLPTEGYGELETQNGYGWVYESVPAGSGERTIFVDLLVKDNMREQINSNSSVIGRIVAGIVYSSGTQSIPGPGGPDADTKMVSAPVVQHKTTIGDLFGASKASADGVSPSSADSPFNSFDYAEMDTVYVAVNWASDPNFFIVSPEILLPGSQHETLNYSAHFQNNGSASAINLDVQVALDPLLKQSDLQTLSTNPACLEYKNTTSGALIWTNKGKTGPIEDPTSICKLNALDDARRLGFAVGDTWGNVNYTIRTQPGVSLKNGQRILAQAAVTMDGTVDSTNVAVVQVGTPAFCYKNLFGLKYYQHLANDEHRSGLGIALTMRRPLGKVQNPDFIASKTGLINKKYFPVFWWQAELGYGQSKLQFAPTDSFFLRHIDVTPFMLRFIAKKPPLRFGSVGFQRGWGLSAAYTASYLFQSKHNDSEDLAFDKFSFGQRLDHSISLSADFLNLIGHPGISVGAGWRWRNSNITGQRQWYQNAFVYLHYTFSHRLKYEFSWLH